MTGLTPTTGACVPRSGLPDAGQGQDGAEGHHGVAGRQQQDVGLAQRVQDAGGGDGTVQSEQREAVRRHLGVHPYPPLLQVHGPALRVLDQHVGLDRLVRHRQQRTPGRQRPASAAVTSDKV